VLTLQWWDDVHSTRVFELSHLQQFLSQTELIGLLVVLVGNVLWLFVARTVDIVDVVIHWVNGGVQPRDSA
jgi:hypothetical protein